LRLGRRTDLGERSFADVRLYDEPQTAAALPTSGYTACRTAVAVPTLIDHMDREFRGAAQFINVAINPTGRRDHPWYAGQRHLVGAGKLDRKTVTRSTARQRRLRQDDRLALQRVHRRIQRFEFRERRPDKMGDHLGPDREQRRGRRVLLAADR
jgi:hypothetical protein